jgi:hypothetical protein
MRILTLQVGQSSLLFRRATLGLASDILAVVRTRSDSVGMWWIERRFRSNQKGLYFTKTSLSAAAATMTPARRGGVMTRTQFKFATTIATIPAAIEAQRTS